MIFGKIQCSEIVPVVFNFRTLSNGKAQSLKNGNDPFTNKADRVTTAEGNMITGQAQVHCRIALSVLPLCPFSSVI